MDGQSLGESEAWVAWTTPVFIRGGGDLGTGVAIALANQGVDVVAVDRARPTAVRLTAAFAATTADAPLTVGGVTAVRADSVGAVRQAWAQRRVAVWIRDERSLRAAGVEPGAVVDARMQGVKNPALAMTEAKVVVALGPGYEAGLHCHYVVETNRGPRLGAVMESGRAEAHTGVPGEVMGLTEQRVMRSPARGALRRVLQIGDFVEAGDVVATVAGMPVRASIRGMVRGLMLDGIEVVEGKKVGDVHPRRDRSILGVPSDKAKRVGAGVVAALRAAHARAPL
jgi:xanthine dehydrogenase accessory factor